MLLLLWLDFWLGTDQVLSRPGLVLAFLGIVSAGLAAGELGHLWQSAPDNPDRKTLVAGSVAMVAISCAPVLWQDYPADCPIGKFGWPFSGMIFALVLTFIFEMRRFGHEQMATGQVTNRISRSALSFAYLNFLFGFLIPHRLMQDNNSIGLIAIVLLISTVKLSDACAYFAGKSLGTIKIAPQLSPQKTLQGSLGALVGGCFAAAIVVYGVAPLVFEVTIAKPWWWFVFYGLVVTVAGMLGDLAESLLKRDSDCKDSGSWLPGLGGILDVIDSLIFAAPVSYFIWLIG
jgi:phosphatidate cytidylyltransferase